MTRDSLGGGLLNLQVGFNTVATYYNYADVIVNGNNYKIPKNYLIMIDPIGVTISENNYNSTINISRATIAFNSFVGVTGEYGSGAGNVYWNIRNIRLSESVVGETIFRISINVSYHSGSSTENANLYYRYFSTSSYNTIPNINITTQIYPRDYSFDFWNNLDVHTSCFALK